MNTEHERTSPAWGAVTPLSPAGGSAADFRMIRLGKQEASPRLTGMSTIWAFDLGKGSIGEAVWDEAQKKFLHVASLLIPAEMNSVTFTGGESES